MGARQKLNGITIQACLIVGGVIGLVLQSWLVFFLASAVLLGLSLYGGEIRPNIGRGASSSGGRSFHNSSKRSSRSTTRRR
ncbi:MAG: hypothetical protein JWN70_2982 [Planctomycetaceae bacterium]|nr:hypothetical protein [Planctomycetaceae bacterium]